MSPICRLLMFLVICLFGLYPASPLADPQIPQDPAALETIITEIKYGWEKADPAPFEKHYLDYEGARYIESGGQNVGLRDLIDHHVVPEGDVLDKLTLTFSRIQTHFEGGFAWAISDVRVEATVKSDGRKIDKSGYETFLFKYVDGSWKVVHTHSSTKSVKK